LKLKKLKWKKRKTNPLAVLSQMNEILAAADPNIFIFQYRTEKDEGHKPGRLPGLSSFVMQPSFFLLDAHKIMIKSQGYTFYFCQV
jgi:hypothetical protein